MDISDKNHVHSNRKWEKRIFYQMAKLQLR